MDDCVRVKAAAKRLSVSTKLVYKLVNKGELLAVRVGRAVCVLASSLEDYIAAHKTGPRLAPVPAAPPVTSSSPSSRRRTPEPAGFLFLPPRS
jgi:excisionase family DNA binding protein